MSKIKTFATILKYLNSNEYFDHATGLYLASTIGIGTLIYTQKMRVALELGIY